ncbi:hypothetical protein GCM10028804_41370 [Larkinella terrae]
MVDYQRFKCHRHEIFVAMVMITPLKRAIGTQFNFSCVPMARVGCVKTGKEASAGFIKHQNS